MKPQYTELGLLRELEIQIDRAGSEMAWCKAHRVHRRYLYDVRHGLQHPGPKIVKALGFQKQVFYVRNKEATHG